MEISSHKGPGFVLVLVEFVEEHLFGGCYQLYVVVMYFLIFECGDLDVITGGKLFQLVEQGIFINDVLAVDCDDHIAKVNFATSVFPDTYHAGFGGREAFSN